MSRCPDCGMKECCGSYMNDDIERLKAEIDELKDALRVCLDALDDTGYPHEGYRCLVESVKPIA